MKSAVFYGKHDLRVEETPTPAPGRGEVLIQVKACGVCGTDVHIFEGDKGAAAVSPPTILGHEFSGVVAAVGEGVTAWRPGDRVCVDPNDTCGACGYCRGGSAQFCEHITGIGTTVNGGFAEYCSVSQKQVYRLADTTTFEEGAMTEPLACCLHGIDLCEIAAGDAVIVIGGGMIGMLMLQLARLRGAARTALLEPVERKRELGRRLGADVCIDPRRGDAKEALVRAGIHRAAAVIECAGLPVTAEQAVDLAGKRSVVMLFGLTRPDDVISVKPFDLFQKEAVLKASYINPYTQGRALELINSRRVDVSSMVGEICGLSQLSAVLSDPGLRAKGKFIVDPDR